MSLYKMLFPKFQKHLTELQCYYILNPLVLEDNSTYKNTNNYCKLRFVQDTSITKCSNFKFNGSSFGFDFTNFHDILSDDTNVKKPFDIIGYVFDWSTLETTTTDDGKASKRISVTLKDLDEEIMPLTLWDDYADQVATYMQENPEDAHVVFIVQFGHLKQWRVDKYFSNCYNATRLIINEEVKELVDFKTRYIEKFFGQHSSTQRSMSSSMISSLEAQFLSRVMFTSIKGIKNVKQAKSLVIVGTITGVPDKITWCYDGCNFCKRRADEIIVPVAKDDGSDDVEFKRVFECNNSKCPHQVVDVTKRLKIPVKVKDSMGGIVTLTLFDHQAEKLLGKSGNDVYENYLDNGSSIENIPDDFKLFMGKKYAFIIEKGDYNLKHKDAEFYAITKLTDDKVIIEKLEEKLLDYPMNEIEGSCNSSVYYEGSQSTFDTKDSFSYTGDSQTPISTFVGDTESDCVKELKRNLNDTFDVDDYDVGSSTKFKKSNEKEKIVCGTNDKLLIPKLEKESSATE